MELLGAEAYVRQATRRRSTKDALAWLNEDRAVPRPIDLPRLLGSLLTIEEQAPTADMRGLAGRVIRQVCRAEVVSELDPSQELLALDEVLRPAQYRAALDALAARTASRTLASVTIAAVIAAQQDDRNVVTALCAAAGLSYRDLRARVRGASVPTDLRGNWKNDQLKAVFDVIDAVITGRVTATSPAAQPARPVEHLLPKIDDEPGRLDGWDLVEHMRTFGVPYELLLTQRAVGSACMVGYSTAAVLSPLHEPDRLSPATLVTAAMGVGLLAAAPYVVTAWAGARAAMARALLGPRESDRLGDRLVEVTRSRARLVDAFEIERRRIERDLHDGAQQRLVALNVYLGLARLEVPPGSPAHDPLVKAHDLARRALSELRELIRGVHPQVLTDRGLAAALHDLAGRSPVPVDLDVRLPGRLPQPIEVTAYFVVGEALTNIARHSAASGARVSAALAGDRLILRITDDGIGGADPQSGTGIAGLADRVAAVGGKVSLSSPTGGPTVVQAEFAGAAPDGE